ncbi:MAG: DegT/DnrJ/EryC1/StrS family aminotransferase [bacterium]|nr:DegT/DnrJ/EryC1/StrS family aminotransferase [Planctomycetota bacterium]HIL51151.1 DegT/DnrJ/EryC1/StrS family aminotransferase [Planctomycetota bacterium]
MSPSTEPKPIPPINLAAERAELGPELLEAIQGVLMSGWYVLGPEVQKFEEDFAAFCHAKHAVGVASGTDALILALKALGVEPGDGVVTSPFTFFASAGAVAWIGARPQLADIDLDTGLLDLEAARAACDGTTKCLLPVHLYGQLVDMRGFRALADEKGLALLEDAAQASGARRDGVHAGELGDAAAFSFYPTKNLGAAGEGGGVLTNSDETHEALLRLRDHGSSAKYVHDSVGTNSRLQAIQGAVLNLKLPHLAEWNARRSKTAASYDAAFAASDCLCPLAVAEGSQPVYHQYALRVLGQGLRDEVLKSLLDQGIAAALHYPRAVHLQRAAADWGYGEGAFPEAERLAQEVLCLPIHPFLTPGEVQRVTDCVLESAR